MVLFPHPPKLENATLLRIEGEKARVEGEPRWWNVTIYNYENKQPIGTILTKKTTAATAADFGNLIFHQQLKTEMLYVVKVDPMRDEFDICPKYADRFIPQEEKLKIAALPFDEFRDVLNGVKSL